VQHSSDVLILGSTFRINIPLKTLMQERWALRRTVDVQDWEPCHSLAPEMSDGNRSEGAVLRLSRYKRDTV
jgi:hypothetical protein